MVIFIGVRWAMRLQCEDLSVGRFRSSIELFLRILLALSQPGAEPTSARGKEVGQRRMVHPAASDR